MKKGNFINAQINENVNIFLYIYFKSVALVKKGGDSFKIKRL